MTGKRIDETLQHDKRHTGFACTMLGALDYGNRQGDEIKAKQLRTAARLIDRGFVFTATAVLLAGLLFWYAERSFSKPSDLWWVIGRQETAGKPSCEPGQERPGRFQEGR